jgi:pimeloyl-ACP methyl ester carboxylesterase
MPTARNADVELVFDVDGAGPDLLLISGSASTRAIWSLVRPQLSQGFRTIAFDNRDSGESTIARKPYTMEDLARDARAVLDAAGSEQAHLLGHSMGGVAAQELALSYPSRVTTLTLVSTWARTDVYSRNLMGLMAGLTESVADDRTLLAAILFAGAGITTLRTTSLAQMVDAAMALGPLAPREALLRQWQLDIEVDTLGRLSRLAVPTHVIWGTEDVLLPPWLSEELLAAIPNAKGTPIEKCGHLPMVNRPQAFIDAVTPFLS